MKKPFDEWYTQLREEAKAISLHVGMRPFRDEDKSIWLGYYNDDLSPKEALTEAISNWED